MHKYVVPFKTPVDYFRDVLGSCYDNIDYFKDCLDTLSWNGYDDDLHVYPYNEATPGILSVGCPNRCPFCPSAAVHKGKIHFGHPEIILPKYANRNVHFMDENFFYNDMPVVLPLFHKFNIKFLAMADYKSTKQVLEEYGENYLYACGLRVIEIGLENVVLYPKVKERIRTKDIAIYYLNMTCLPGETKESIVENAKWMRDVSLKNTIHHNNGVWYACGQFFHPYEQQEGGKYLEGNKARVRPSWIPDSLLVQEFEIVDLQRANFFGQLVLGRKIYNPPMQGCFNDAFWSDQENMAWLLTAVRCGAAK